jgi:hypothetical protein
MAVHEIKNFCTTKFVVVSKLKRPLIKWEKIFTGYTSDKQLITRIYRELKKLNYLKVNDPIKKQATELIELFQRKKSK